MRSLASIFCSSVLLLMSFDQDAQAEATISVSQGISGMPNIGRVVAHGYDTYRVDAATGVITFTDSNARVGPSVVAVPSYTITCTSGVGPANLCGAAPPTVTITVQPATKSGNAFISALNIAITPGPGATSCDPALGQDTINVSVTCTLAPQSDNEQRTVATIRIGTSVTVTGSQSQGDRSLTYVISTT